MLIDPYLGLEKVFEYFTLPQYLEHLYEWLNASLSPNVKIEDQQLVTTIYRNLQILIESAWLIYSREYLAEPFEETRFDADPTSPVEKVEKETIAPNLLVAFQSF